MKSYLTTINAYKSAGKFLKKRKKKSRWKSLSEKMAGKNSSKISEEKKNLT